jgi:PHS family inorganic phosphate transporter-like MFS transporter
MDLNHDLLGEPAVPPTYPRTYGGNAAFHNFNNDYSHILDPNLRRRLALSEIDKVPFGWYVLAIVRRSCALKIDLRR